MTGLLRDTMNERADAVGYPQLDLDGIIAAGERRVRRRRVVAAGSVSLVAAAVVAAVAVGPSTLDLNGEHAPTVGTPDAPFAQDRPTYAAGSQIHYGVQVLQLDYQVRTFAQTDAGFVYTASGGQVRFADGHLERQIGMTDARVGWLAADSSGPYVAWLDPTGSGAPEFVVYDTAVDEEVVRTAKGSLADPEAQYDINTMSAVIAIDEGVVYWHDGAGVQAYDIASGGLTLVKDGADANWLDDVENGVLAHQAELHYRGDAGSQEIVVSADPDAAGPGFSPWSHGYLPPDAQHVAVFGGDQTQILDVTSGANVTPPHRGYGLVHFGQWIDDDTLTFVAFPGATPSGDTQDLLTCSISAQTCDVAAADIGGAGRDPVILPGMPLG